MMYLQASALMALVASVSAHMRISEPVPFGWDPAVPMQDPLNNAGRANDYPCKQPSGTYAVTSMNKYKAGDNISVKILGGATHGGGSCQFSITTDTKPTKNTQWKVLFSQIGACPGGPPTDNLSNDANDARNAPFSVPIPKDLPSGKYTFAWTWNNKLGNREFYMNCAPLEISGGSGDASKVLGDLPDMFTVNLTPNSKECQLDAGQDALYPNPGKNVKTAAGAKPGLKLIGGGCASMTKVGGGNGKLGAPAQATGTTPEKPTGNGPVLAPTEPTTVPKPDTPAPAPVAPAPVTPAPAGGVTCTTDGALVCIGSSNFGICNRGSAVSQPLAAGVKCSNGQLSRRSIFGSWFD